MVAVTDLNHITIAVSQLSRSFDFYVDILGFTPRARWANGAYLSAGNLWLCLSQEAARPATDYTHIAFSVDETDIDDWLHKLDCAGVRQWKRNVSEGNSIYILDPDGHQLELHVGDLNTRLSSLANEPYAALEIFPDADNLTIFASHGMLRLSRSINHCS